MTLEQIKETTQNYLEQTPIDAVTPGGERYDIGMREKGVLLEEIARLEPFEAKFTVTALYRKGELEAENYVLASNLEQVKFMLEQRSNDYLAQLEQLKALAAQGDAQLEAEKSARVTAEARVARLEEAARAVTEDAFVNEQHSENGMRWRHLGTDGTYSEIARGFLEHDSTRVVIYKSEGMGTVWVRPEAEFEDGRFVRIIKETPDA